MGLHGRWRLLALPTRTVVQYAGVPIAPGKLGFFAGGTAPVLPDEYALIGTLVFAGT